MRSASVSGKKRVFSLIQPGLNELTAARSKKNIIGRQIVAKLAAAVRAFFDDFD